MLPDQLADITFVAVAGAGRRPAAVSRSSFAFVVLERRAAATPSSPWRAQHSKAPGMQPRSQESSCTSTAAWHPGRGCQFSMHMQKNLCRQRTRRATGSERQRRAAAESSLQRPGLGVLFRSLPPASHSAAACTSPQQCLLVREVHPAAGGVGGARCVAAAAAPHVLRALAEYIFLAAPRDSQLIAHSSSRGGRMSTVGGAQPLPGSGQANLVIKRCHQREPCATAQRAGAQYY